MAERDELNNRQRLGLWILVFYYKKPVFLQNKIHFKIEYASNSYDFLAIIKNRKRSFGYLSLPVYLMDLNRGLTKLKRQNYLTKIYEGRGIGLGEKLKYSPPSSVFVISLISGRTIYKI